MPSMLSRLGAADQIKVKRRQQLLEAGRLARERAAMRRAQLAELKVGRGLGWAWFRCLSRQCAFTFLHILPQGGASCHSMCVLLVRLAAACV